MHNEPKNPRYSVVTASGHVVARGLSFSAANHVAIIEAGRVVREDS